MKLLRILGISSSLPVAEALGGSILKMTLGQPMCNLFHNSFGPKAWFAIFFDLCG